MTFIGQAARHITSSRNFTRSPTGPLLLACLAGVIVIASRLNPPLRRSVPAKAVIWGMHVSSSASLLSIIWLFDPAVSGSSEFEATVRSVTQFAYWPRIVTQVCLGALAALVICSVTKATWQRFRRR